MKRTIGIVFLVAGLVASLIFGLDAYQKTESVKILGSKITLSQADWTPFIVSLVVLVIGVIMIFSYQPKSKARKRK